MEYNSTNRDSYPGNSGSIIGEDVALLIDLIDKTVLSCLIGLFGIVTNIINMIVFVRQRFTDPVNVSLFGVAISDIFGLACLLWGDIGSHPLLIKHVELPYEPNEFITLTAGSYRVCFSKITCCITIFITIQRCLCISIPLKVNTVLTPRLTAFIVFLLFVAAFLINTLALFCTEGAKITSKFFKKRNRTLLGVVFSSDWDNVYQINSILMAVFQISSFLTIILSTIVLVVSLNRKTKWRDSALASHSVQSLAKRDRTLAKLVIILAVILITCYFPGTVGLIISYIFPEFDIYREQQNIYVLTWMLSIFMETVNSSTNIFVYYKMSSKYRRTLNEMFCIDKKIQGKQ